MNGSITVHSDIDKGSQFLVTLDLLLDENIKSTNKSSLKNQDIHLNKRSSSNMNSEKNSDRENSSPKTRSILKRKKLSSSSYQTNEVLSGIRVPNLPNKINIID